VTRGVPGRVCGLVGGLTCWLLGARGFAAAPLPREQSLAERFSPVIVNEERYLKRDLLGGTRVPNKGDFSPVNQLDRVDQVFYDVAETETHVFLSYQIMKAWSANPMPGIYAGARHPVDSEDVFVVLRKDAKGGLVPVLYATNRHGQRLVYPVKSEVDAAEYATLTANTARGEVDGPPWTWFNGGQSGNYFGASPAVQKTFAGSPVADASLLVAHPVVGSSYMTHAVTRARIPGDHARDPTLVAYVSNYAANAREGILKEDARQRVKTYALVPLKDVLPDMMKFVYNKGPRPEVRRCQFTKEANASQSFQLKLGESPSASRVVKVEAERFPSHFYPEWYFTRYRPNMLPWFNLNRAKLDIQKADTAYSGHNGISQTPGLCRRLDPAAEFCRTLPKTCAQHGVKPGQAPLYSHYALIEEALPRLEAIESAGETVADEAKPGPPSPPEAPSGRHEER
jgi:hypothetical protein